MFFRKLNTVSTVAAPIYDPHGGYFLTAVLTPLPANTTTTIISGSSVFVGLLWIIFLLCCIYTILGLMLLGNWFFFFTYFGSFVLGPDFTGRNQPNSLMNYTFHPVEVGTEQLYLFHNVLRMWQCPAPSDTNDRLPGCVCRRVFPP